MTPLVAAARRPRIRTAAPGLLAERAAALDWARIADELEAHGCANTPALLAGDECSALADMYPSEQPFRSRVVMARHGFGRGRKKVTAAFPVLPRVLTHQPEVGLVDQGGRLQRLAWLFVRHLLRRELAQLVVDQR